jgi:hypothetical protein
MLSEKEKFAQRLNAVLDEEHYPAEFEQRQLALAHALYIDSAVISMWLKGEDFPKTSELVKLSQLLKVRSNWLLLGVGGKFDHSDDNVQPLQINESATDPVKLSDLSQDAYDLAQDWMRLPLQQRNALATLIKTLVIQQSQSDSDQLKENS